MNESEIYNPDGSEEGLPLNIPSGYAWDDMRRKLDDDMPVPGVLLPDNIIYVGNGFMRSIASLFILLCITSIALWVGEANVKHSSNRSSDTAFSTTKKSLNALDAKNNSADGLVAANNKGAQQHTSPGPLNTNILSGEYRGVKKYSTNKQAGTKSFGASRATIANSSKRDAITNYRYSPEADSNPVQNPPSKKAAKIVAAEKKDTAAHEEDTEQNEDKGDIKVQAGLQWNGQVPFAGAANYFVAPNGVSQPYRVLLPSVWLSVQAEKYLLIAEVNPFNSTVFNPKPFTTLTSKINAQTTQTETKNLGKLFGVSAVVKANYNIAGNWWAGAGLQANFWHKGVSNNYYTVTSTSNTAFYKTTTSFNDSDWVHFSKFQLRGDAEVMYKTPNWHAGLRAGLFLTPAAKDYNGPKSPLQIELFYRLVLLNLMQHKKTK